jgi:hypothetical protein
MLKVKSLCSPILANDPWVPGTNEADEIDAIVLEELGLTIKPRAQERLGRSIRERLVIPPRIAQSHVPTCDLSYEYETSTR